jgi:hypothetical protein
VKWRSVAACEHQRRPCHGMTEAPGLVTSSCEQQGEKGNVGQGSNEREERSAALATEDRKSDGALVSSEWGKVGNVPLPPRDWLK